MHATICSRGHFRQPRSPKSALRIGVPRDCRGSITSRLMAEAVGAAALAGAFLTACSVVLAGRGKLGAGALRVAAARTDCSGAFGSVPRAGEQPGAGPTQRTTTRDLRAPEGKPGVRTDTVGRRRALSARPHALAAPPAHRSTHVPLAAFAEAPLRAREPAAAGECRAAPWAAAWPTIPPRGLGGRARPDEAASSSRGALCKARRAYCAGALLAPPTHNPCRLCKTT